MEFEALAVAVAQNARSVGRAAELLGLEWKSLWRILERAVGRGLERRSVEELKAVGLDEKSFGRGQSYVTVLSDPRGARVLEVVPERSRASGEAALASLPTQQREKLEAVVMDMSAGYEAAAKAQAPAAAIVYDRFHVSKLLNDAVDKVRRTENRQLREEGDERLVGTKYQWLRNPESISEEKMGGFAELAQSALRTARAWYHRILFGEFWTQSSATTAGDFFKRWHGGARRSRLEPVRKAAQTLKTHLLGLLNYFTHRLTNAMAEALNGRIQAIKANARGFRSFANYRIAILFHLGKLDLIPR
jgi:transposase